jgi:hypothetical protein
MCCILPPQNRSYACPLILSVSNACVVILILIAFMLLKCLWFGPTGLHRVSSFFLHCLNVMLSFNVFNYVTRFAQLPLSQEHSLSSFPNSHTNLDFS